MISCFVDPACGWSAVASQWLEEVSGRVGATVEWRPYSLLLRDGADLPPPVLRRREASHRALRVMAAVRDVSPAGAGRFYAAVRAQGGAPAPFGDLVGALAAAGVEVDLAGAADDERVDAVIRDAMAEADAAVGGTAKLPVLAFGDRGFTGPLLDEIPPPREADLLWDAVSAAARVPALYELSRHRPAAPRFVRELLDGR